jgi:hypothetical protein
MHAELQAALDDFATDPEQFVAVVTGAACDRGGQRPGLSSGR